MACKDREATALVAWVLHGDAGTDNKVVTEVVYRRFGLHRDEVTISLHHLETYLIKFVSKRTRDELGTECVTRRSSIMKPWRFTCGRGIR